MHPQQYDYMASYLSLDKAREIAPQYVDYPVKTWNKYFAEVRQLIQEVDGNIEETETTKAVEPTLN